MCLNATHERMWMEWNEIKKWKKSKRKNPRRWNQIELPFLAGAPIERNKKSGEKKSPYENIRTATVWVSVRVCSNEILNMNFHDSRGWRRNWRQKFCQAEKWVKSDSSLCKRVNDVNGIAVRVLRYPAKAWRQWQQRQRHRQRHFAWTMWLKLNWYL